MATSGATVVVDAIQGMLRSNIIEETTSRRDANHTVVLVLREQRVGTKGRRHLALDHALLSGTCTSPIRRRSSGTTAPGRTTTVMLPKETQLKWNASSLWVKMLSLTPSSASRKRKRQMNE